MARARIQYNGGIIKPRGNSWQASIYLDHRHLRRSFKTKPEAKSWIDSVHITKDRSLAQPTPAEMIEYREARAMLPPQYSIQEAVRHFTRKHGSTEAGINVADLCARFMKKRIESGMRPRRLAQLKYTTDRLCALFGEMHADQIEPAHLQSVLDAHEVTGYTRDGHRRAYHALFSYGKRTYSSPTPPQGHSPATAGTPVPSTS